MDPRLLKRPSSTRSNCWNGSALETREWKTLQTAQLEAALQGTMAQQASTTRGQVKTSVRLVDTKLVTKQNAFSGEQGGQERWRTVSFMMRAYCAAHVTKLYCTLSMLLGDKALDTGRTRPVRDGAKRWSLMVTCWETKAFFRVQRTLQAILVMTCYIHGTDMTQLQTVWTDQVKESKRTATQHSASARVAGIQERMTKAAVCQVCDDRGQSAKGYWYQGQRKSTRTKDTDMTTRRKELATIAKWSVILR